MEQHVNTLLTVYGEDLNRLRNRVGKDRSENTFRAMNMGKDFSIYLSADKGLRGGTVWLAKRILKIMQEIGVTKHITMHCARHSFAVLALTKGMPIESVSRILGHTNITTTQIYSKITMQKLNADMDDLEKQLQDLSSLFSEFCHLLRYII